MELSDLKRRIENGEYRVDSSAVAQAMLNHAPTAYWLTESLSAPSVSSEQTSSVKLTPAPKVTHAS